MSIAHPFAGLIAPLPVRHPKSTSITVVVCGKRVATPQEVKGRSECAEQSRQAVATARRAARYQVDRLNPEAMAKRAAWDEANREKRRAQKRAWDAANLERNRELKRAWQKRTYVEKAEERRASSRAYYLAHREEILAKAKAARVAAKANKLKAAKA